MSLLGGIRPPIAVLSALLLALAGLTALKLGKADPEPVPKAVLVSQQHFAEDGAIALRASLDESVTDLTRSAALLNAGKPVSADAVLDKVGSVYQKWRGTAVIEISSGRLLAARGENLPLTAIDRTRLSDEDGLAPRMIRLENGETRLLTLAVLSWEGQPQQLLVASSSLRFPGISLGRFRSIAVVDYTGKILSSDIADPEQMTDPEGRAAKRADKQLREFAAQAAEKADQHPLKAKEPGSGGFPGISGHLKGGKSGSDRAVAGYAKLTAPQPGERTAITDLGLTVVAMTHVSEQPTGPVKPLFGLAAAGALLVIGAIAVAVLLGLVQRPLIRLFLESRRLTRGDLQRPVNVPRYGEAARIAAALERLRRQLLGEPAETGPGTEGRPRGLRRIGTRSLVACCAVLLLAWSAPLVFFLNRAGDTVIVPQQLVDDQRERTNTLTDRVRRALNEGYADLVSVASLMGDRTSSDEMASVLERTLAEHLRYQSLYLLDAKGEVLARAGEKPSHPAGKGPGGQPIDVLGEGGKEPVVTAYAEVPGREGTAVVGEFRIDFLNSLLKRQGLGQVRLVDAEARVLAGNSGFRAFEELPDRLSSLVKGTGIKVGLSARASGILYRDGDDVEIAAAAPFAGGGAAKSLGWTVVSWQPAAGLAIPEYRFQNRTVLAGLLGLTATAACLGWLYIVVARPLRELAGQAESLASGDRRTVLYPRHHDEVGAIARSLELIRQQLSEARRRKAPPADTSRGPAAASTPAGRS
mgnify:CR=1 FL=1